MPKKSTATRKRSSTKRPSDRTSAKRNATSNPDPIAPANITVYGLYKNRNSVARSLNNLKNAGFRHVDVTELAGDESTAANAYAEPASTPSLTSIAGNIAGCLAGIALFAPLAIAAPLFPGISSVDEADDSSKQQDGGALLKVRCEGLDRLQQVTEILESTGARDVATSVEGMGEGPISERLKLVAREQELQARKYRDEEGNVHHHTRTFIEQHGTEEALA